MVAIKREKLKRKGSLSETAREPEAKRQRISEGDSPKNDQPERLLAGGGAGSLWASDMRDAPKGDDLGQVSFNPSIVSREKIFSMGVKTETEAPKTSFFKVIQTEVKKNEEASSLPLAVLVDVWERIGDLQATGTGSVKKVVVLLANLMRLVLVHSKEDLIPLVMLSQNKVAAEQEGVELGVGDSILMRAVAETYGRQESMIKEDLKTMEDLGVIAASSRKSLRTLKEAKPLTIASTFQQLKNLAKVSGASSQGEKKSLINRLLLSARGQEPKYIVRFIQGRLRIGAQLATIQQALGCAFCLSPRREPMSKDLRQAIDEGQEGIMMVLDAVLQQEKEHSMTFIADVREDEESLRGGGVEAHIQNVLVGIKLVFSCAPDMDRLVRVLMSGVRWSDLPKLAKVRIGVPVLPMLAKPTKAVDEVLKRFRDKTFQCDFKYDGERAQIHFERGRALRIFSRSLEDMSGKYPDLLKPIEEAFSKNEVSNAILDAEVVAYDLQTNRIRPFQVLATRKRKSVEVSGITVQVCLFIFDALLMNDVQLVDKPLEKRREVLLNKIMEVRGRVQLAITRDCVTADEIDEFLGESVEAACEGLMVKELDAPYEPSKRSLSWLKLKKDYVSGIGDTLDLVPLGAFYGGGKRVGVFGAYLLGCRDEHSGLFQSTCKVGTGFDVETLKALHESLSKVSTEKKPTEYQVDEKMTPDVWFIPSTVWEVRAADLQSSPVHTAAIGLAPSERGIGLRFPRFVRIRDDKKPDDATTAEQILNMFEQQAVY